MADTPPPGGFFESWQMDAAAAAAQPVTAPPDQTPAPPYRPTLTLTRLVVVLLCADLGLTVLDIAFSMVALRHYTSLQAGGPAVSGALTVLTTNEALFSGIRLLTLLATGVAFLLWFTRLYGNLGPLGQAARQRHRTGWAAGGWFVPFLNLVRPKHIADDIWAASEPDPELAVLRQLPRSKLLGWWWAFWLLSAILSRGVLASFRAAEDLDSLMSSYRLAIGSAVLDVVACVLAIAVVLALGRRQQAHAQHRAREGALPPAFRHPEHV